jgi:peroxiredoxin
MIEEKKIPTITFQCRVGDEAPEDGGCPIGGEFVGKTTDDLFAGKRVIVFSLPGAFTPTCSTYQLPGFEENYKAITNTLGIDEIYVSSVNDSFVMNAWAQHLGIKNVKVIPDGNGEFTRHMGMLVNMSGATFGYRSWRYAVVVDNKKITHWFVEPGKQDNLPDDPYGESAPENILKALST